MGFPLKMIEQVLEKLKFESLNDMQHAAIRTAEKHDTILLSPTGSGKTLAFLVPLLQRLKNDSDGLQGLILVPSRELALQIGQVFRSLGSPHKINICYGGHPVRTERNNFDGKPALLIGTPGRILYHLRNDNFDPSAIHTLILDEFDKSLEFGFEEDMKAIIARLSGIERRILTSATKMDTIPSFTRMQNPKEVNFLKDQTVTPDLQLRKIISLPAEKLETLYSLLCKIGSESSLVFCNHREAVDRISEVLADMNVEHGLFHGGMEQEDREKALLKFRNGSYRILVTTDLASRGLDIPEIGNIIHYQLPPNEESFLHRNGRTARMNASGKAFVILTEEENPGYLKPELEIEDLPNNLGAPEPTEWVTIYIAAGKKDKVNKIDIVGLMLQKGKLKKEELGLIEVHDYASYAAIRRNKVNGVLKLVAGEKIKNKKAKIEISR